LDLIVLVQKLNEERVFIFKIKTRCEIELETFSNTILSFPSNLSWLIASVLECLS